MASGSVARTAQPVSSAHAHNSTQLHDSVLSSEFSSNCCCHFYTITKRVRVREYISVQVKFLSFTAHNQFVISQKPFDSLAYIRAVFSRLCLSAAQNYFAVKHLERPPPYVHVCALSTTMEVMATL